MDYRPIVESRYDRAAWQKLLHDVFSGKERFFASPAVIPVAKAVAEEALLLGDVTLSDGQKIGVYEVRLTERKNLEHNRVELRNLLVSNWKQYGYAGSFQFCYKDGEAVLRFSYVSEVFEFTPSGEYAKNATNTKRFTYLLGEGHRSRTAIQQFEELKRSDLTLADITKAFSVEAVSARFFADYKRNYEDIIECVTGKRMVKTGGKWEEKKTGNGDKSILAGFAAFENPEKAIRDYVKKLMGRLVFLQFIQKKGWLGVPKGGKWGDGDREFLQHLFERFTSQSAQTSFIDSVLEPLFDDINARRKNDLANAKLGKDILVPYLNGGLFEPDAADAAAFPLPSKRLQALFDFFGSYNFTIDENDPDDAEVGIDPEMLSRIFENLLEDNKDKGAFYTPKSIVDYMCRESLIAYLQTETSPAGRARTPAAPQRNDQIANFVKTHDASALPPALRAELLQKLREVKICDPAIGSGAFPMGLLKELFACRAALGDPLAEHPAVLKRAIIENNIYGVDIEKGAVDIARLRFWLALVVDEETPHALPNLDFKIMQGNSLLESFGGVPLDHVLEGGSAAIAQGVYKGGKKAGRKRSDYWQSAFAFDGRDAIKEIVRDKNALFNETDHEVKKLLISRINKNVKAFISSKLDPDSPYQSQIPDGQNDQFFLWHTWFSDVFNRPGREGFDIVIGNPPYKLCQPSNTDAKTLASFKMFDVASYKIDLFHLFFEQGLKIARIGGILSYITSNTYLTNKYIAPLRKYIIENAQVLQLLVHSNEVFDSACVEVATICLQRGCENEDRPIQILKQDSNNHPPTELRSIKQSEWKENPDYIFTVDEDYGPVKGRCTTLGDVCDTYFGIQAYDKKSSTANSKKAKHWRPIIDGADVIRYGSLQPHNYFDYRPETIKSGGDERVYSQGRILVRQIGQVPFVGYVDAGVLTSNTIYNVYLKNSSFDIKYVLGVLASSYIRYFWMKHFCDNKKLFPKIKGYQLKQLPIPKATKMQQQLLVKVADRILAEKKKDPDADTSALESQIDQIVYKLYDLTPEEIAIVESAVGGKS